MRQLRILVVDDDLAVLKYLRANLREEGYDVLTALNGIEAIQTIEKELPDLLILDIMMPTIDGFEVCSRIREWSQIPIIMLSARDDESDKVKSLDLGADDYLTKPFGIKELMARVRSVLRRTEVARAISPQPTFVHGDFKVNFSERRVTIADREIKLTPTEYCLLREFVSNAGKVLTHAFLLGRAWGPEYCDEHEYLHVFVRRLRSKLESEPSNPKYIITVPGVGYRFESDSDSVK